MRKIIEIVYRQPDNLSGKLSKKQRNFQIHTQAYCLGLIETDATLAEMMQMSANVSDYIIDSLVEKIVEVRSHA
jgi:hypothetical protein